MAPAARTTATVGYYGHGYVLRVPTTGMAMATRYRYGYPYYGYRVLDRLSASGIGYPYYGYLRLPVCLRRPHTDTAIRPATSRIGGSPYGGVRIQGAPRNAEVYVDGSYVGIVDDFDGAFQRLELEPGAHSIEIRAPGVRRSPTTSTCSRARRSRCTPTCANLRIGT